MATSVKTDPDLIDDIDNPELTDADFARAVPFEVAHPDLLADWKRGRGRPTINGQVKKHIGFRLPADVVDAVKATGKGYNARVEKLLREAIAKGVL